MSSSSASAEGAQQGAAAILGDIRGDTAPLWADPDHPEIDCILTPFERAYNEGHRISDWWVLEERRRD